MSTSSQDYLAIASGIARASALPYRTESSIERIHLAVDGAFTRRKAAAESELPHWLAWKQAVAEEVR